MTRYAVCLSITAVLYAGGASAKTDAFYDGNALHKLCQQNNATGYVIGLSDTYDSMSNMLKTKKSICPSTKVTAGQMKDVICLSLAQHPETRHLTAASLAMLALSNAFPCN
ncbi:Rap1a/Tai family immunity protein [Bosea sp. (in: a-proteobacteria)]|uniref:Rap1a/Tai family immunity protein n=1 Tax=Bosea sp. (in: a-proteobacteria) TaxID=1871050 RepID=UPI003523DDFC